MADKTEPDETAADGRSPGSWRACLALPARRQHGPGPNLAGRKAVHDVLDDLISILFPGCHGGEPGPAEAHAREPSGQRLRPTRPCAAQDQAERAFQYQCDVRPLQGLRRLRRSAPKRP